MAHQEVQVAQEALEKVDPEDTKEITRLQNQAKLARHFEQWLAELITKGDTAIAVYAQQRDQ